MIRRDRLISALVGSLAGQGEIMWGLFDYFGAMIAASIILIPLALGAGYEPPGGIHAYEPLKLIQKLPPLHLPTGH
jgi:hypothetical protein